MVLLKSIHNTTIEGIWHWLCKTSEHNFLHKVRRGYDQGIFNPNDPRHVYVLANWMNRQADLLHIHSALFNWLWPPICQVVLDKFVAYWNSHRVQFQKNKSMPSGATPCDIFTSPQVYGGKCCSIPIPQEAVDVLRDDLPVSRDEALHFIDDAVATTLDDIWNSISSPPRTVSNGWEIFTKILPHLSNI